MKRFICYSLVVAFLISSCTSATEISVSPNTVVINPSETSAGIPLSTLTEIPLRISTASTTTIPVPATPAYTPTATPMESASLLTAQASWEVCDGAEEPNYRKDLSPNGEWLAIICDPNDSSKFIGTKIVKLDGNVIWDVPFYDTYGIFQKNEFPPDGIRKGRMSIVRWTKDGNYAYLVPYFCCIDEPENIFFNYFQNTWALYRLDLGTGKITATLPPFSDGFTSGYNSSISPTGKYLTYVISNSPREIHLDNLQTGDSYLFRIDDPYIASGNFVWSQDGNKAVYVAVKAGWIDRETPLSNEVSYFLLDLKTKSSNHLFDQQDMYRVSWTQDGNIILHNASGDNGLFYNFQNNTFTTITPTPTP